MNLEQLIADVQAVHRTYLKNKQLAVDDAWFVMKLAEELGELTQAYLRLRYRRQTSPEEVEQARTALGDECADLLCHVLLFTTRNDIDIVGSIQRKWSSYLESTGRSSSS
jgi:NTP pyrophosphatase (non-canonical NTP hydrolase)